MKKTFTLFLGILLFFIFSCKKTYTCSCDTTYTFKNSDSSGYTPIVLTGSKTPYSQKMTLKKARAACAHEQTAIQTDFTDNVTVSGYHPLVSGESVVSNCSIKQ